MFARGPFKRRERAQSAPPSAIFRDAIRGAVKQTKRSDKPRQFRSERTIRQHPPEADVDDNATVSTSSESRSFPSSRKTDRVNALVNALQNAHLLDVTLVGKERVRVRASKYILTCRCEYFANKFAAHAYDQGAILEEQEEEQVYVGEYEQPILQAMVDFCFTGELTDFLQTHASLPSLESVEHIIQLAKMGIDLSFLPLQIEAYQVSRRFMNQHLHTACLFYAQGKTCPLDVLKYATCTLQECPEQALFGTETFVSHLDSKRIETLIQSLEHDLQELEKVQLLQLWLQHEENDLQVAKRLACTYIDLDSCRIRWTDTTVSLLQESNLFDEQDIPLVDSTLITSTEEIILEEDCHEEHVVVTNAGRKAVNGVYIIDVDDDDMYVTLDGDYALYCWKEMWHIAATCDLSNSLYQCASSMSGGEGEKVPSSGWTSVGADRPVPTCVWNAAAEHDSNGERSTSERQEA